MSDEEGPALGQYNDGNRAFLQSFLAHGTLTLEEGKKVLAAIFTVESGQATTPAEVTEEDFVSYVSAAADAISPFDYEIRSTQHQTSKERIWGLVNSVSDPLTQLATSRTEGEIFYIKRLLDAMFETYNTKRKEVMAVTGMEALGVKIRKPSRDDEEASTQAPDKGLTSGEGERLLEKLVKENWLERSRAGFYRLSPRGLMELRSWLVDTYNDSDDPEEWQRIKFCAACKDIVTVGLRCSDLECNFRLHTICETAYWNSKPSKKCPKCETAWDGEHYVGQKAVTVTEEYLKGKRRSGGAKRKSGVAEEEEEEANGGSSRRTRGRVEAEEDAEPESSQVASDE